MFQLEQDVVDAQDDVDDAEDDLDDAEDDTEDAEDAVDRVRRQCASSASFGTFSTNINTRADIFR